MAHTTSAAEPALIAQLSTSPFAVALGMKHMLISQEAVVIRLAYRSDLVGDPDSGVLAGGVVTTLLDHACGHAVLAAMGRMALVVTLDLRIDYMRPAEPGLDVYANANCYKLTNSIGFVRATAYDRSEDDPLATAQAAFIIAGKRT